MKQTLEQIKQQKQSIIQSLADKTKFYTLYFANPANDLSKVSQEYKAWMQEKQSKEGMLWHCKKCNHAVDQYGNCAGDCECNHPEKYKGSMAGVDVTIEYLKTIDAIMNELNQNPAFINQTKNVDDLPRFGGAYPMNERTTNAVLSEREYQERKYPGQKRTIVQYIGIMQKCLDAASKNTTWSKPLDALNEIRQVVATGIVVMDRFGVEERKMPPIIIPPKPSKAGRLFRDYPGLKFTKKEAEEAHCIIEARTTLPE